MNNEPVAWINVEKRKLEWDKPILWETPTVVKLDRIPLYTHPVKELDEDFDAICLENKRLQAEIEALKDMLEEEGIGVSQKYLDERIAELGKVQEK